MYLLEVALFIECGNFFHRFYEFRDDFVDQLSGGILHFAVMFLHVRIILKPTTAMIISNQEEWWGCAGVRVWGYL